MLRILAVAVIMFGCAYLGNMFATACKKRHSQLKELGEIMAQLEFDIDFMGSPLKDSFCKLASRYDGGMGDVLKYVCEVMKSESCVDMAGIWKKAFERYRHELNLKDGDIAIVLEFSKKLGMGDREQEKTNIKGTLMRLKIAEEEAWETQKTNVKMYRGLGILAGMFIVIVLI